MEYEVEQKYPVVDLAQVEASLKTLHASAQPSIEQTDLYFSHPSKDFARTDEALRIRRVGQDNFVTYKGPKLDAATKTRQELEIPLQSGQEGFDQFSSLLSALGFRPVREVRKLRRPFELRWQDRLVHVVLDDVTSVGTFVELELVVGPDEVEAAKECIALLANQLRLDQPDRRSYLEMLIASEGPLQAPE
jgi:adenylate cyclase class 2